jgi:hypothetical protein
MSLMDVPCALLCLTHSKGYFVVYLQAYRQSGKPIQVLSDAERFVMSFTLGFAPILTLLLSYCCFVAGVPPVRQASRGPEQRSRTL